MRTIFALFFIQFFGLSINAQVRQPIVSNNWYFSQSDTLFFSQTHIKANKVRFVKEYRTDRKYADSAQLTSEYSFDTMGSIIESRTYDIHGTQSITVFKNTGSGKLSECWVANTGVLTKTQENVYRGDTLVKQISYYGKGYTTSVEYFYNAAGLLLFIQYYGADGLKGAHTTLTYDSLAHIISEVTNNPGDSLSHSYSYKYDDFGRRYFTEYKEANTSWAITIDYSKSTANSNVERIYSDGKLTEIRTMTFNSQGLVVEKIVDRRMSSKRRKKSNTFCGYSGPPRYIKWIYDYDSNGNLKSEKKYLSPDKVSERIEYTFDSKGNLVNKVVFKNSVRDSEWRYVYS